MQTRLGSITEAWANIAVGFIVNFTRQHNHRAASSASRALTLPDQFHLSAYSITVISLVRSYILRRWFNGLKFGHDNTPAGG